MLILNQLAMYYDGQLGGLTCSSDLADGPRVSFCKSQLKIPNSCLPVLVIVVCVIGSGELAPGKASIVRAQILGFVIFADPANVRALVAAFGSDRDSAVPEAAWDAMLPGPHPLLRCLLNISPGGACQLPM